MDVEPVNPFARRSLGQRLRGVLRTTLSSLIWLPVIVYRGIRSLPLTIRLAAIAVLLPTIGYGGYLTYQKYDDRSRNRAVIAEWQQFEIAAGKGAEPSELQAILGKILAIRPTDPNALARRDALDCGSSDIGDQSMVVMLMRGHIFAGRIGDAAREAAKRHATEPRDWFANCVLAHDALIHGNRDKANPYLTALSNPDSHDIGIEPGGLRYGIEVLRMAGRDVSPVRAFLAKRVLPVMRGENVAKLPPRSLAQFAHCYAETLLADELSPGLAEFWAPATRLAERALSVAIETDDRIAAEQVGELGPRLADGLNRLHAAKQIDADQKNELAAENEDRTVRAWQFVLVKQPKSASAYAGMALSAARTGKPDEVREQIARGLEICGDDPQLLSLYLRVCIVENRPVDAMQRCFTAAEKKPSDLAGWLLAADAALAARQRDKALIACRNARDLAPNKLLVARVETRMWCEAGFPNEAWKVISLYPQTDVARDPIALRYYTRAAIELGEEAKFATIQTLVNETNDPTLALAILQGFADTPDDAERLVRTAKIASTILDRWPSATAAAKIRANVLVRKLELGPTPWDRKVVDEAVKACEFALAAEPMESTITGHLAWLKLRGQDDAAAAIRIIAPLRPSPNRLSSDQIEIVGAVLLANGQPEEAARVLELGSQLSQRKAGTLIQLSRVYRTLGRTSDAESILTVAATIPQTARERIDYRNAVNDLQGKPR